MGKELVVVAHNDCLIAVLKENPDFDELVI